MKPTELLGHPTCRQMCDALNSCIENKWRLLASGAVEPHEEPTCDLCVLSGRAIRNIQAAMPLYSEVSACDICPLQIYSGVTCNHPRAAYQDWKAAETLREGKAKAQEMLNLLLAVKTHFFGHWEGK